MTALASPPRVIQQSATPLPHTAVPFYRHHLGEAEKASLLGALDQTFLTTGNLTAEFERRFELAAAQL